MKSNMIKWGVFGISMGIALCCMALLVYDLVILPSRFEKANTEIRKEYYQIPISPLPPVSESPDNPIQRLQEINEDITAWITIPGTSIDYPVLLSKKEAPNYYLTHDYQKQGSKYGSIFLSPESSTGAKNILLHGHNMKDGSMFAPLLKLTEVEAYRKSPVVWLQTAEGQSAWKIFAMYKVNTRPEQGAVFPYLQSDFSSDAAFLEYVEQVQARSILDTGVEVAAKDSILTLSTCSYEFDDFRTVVAARKMREGEPDIPDTSQVQKKANPLYPECWYKKYGGQPPPQGKE